jgi:mRNA interferase MazF
VSSAKLFGVYTAKLPFIELPTSKIRPVVVVSAPSGQHNLVIVIPLSSQTKRQPVDRALAHWRNAGLVKPTVARVHRLTTMSQADLTSELGVLNTSDIEQLKTALRSLFQLG